MIPSGITGPSRLWLPFIHKKNKSQMYQQTLQSFSKLLRRIQILFPTVSITSQLKCPIITRKPLLTPLKFTVFLANLVSIYSTPVKLVKNQNPQFLTALLLYMGQILNPVSNLKCLKTQLKIRMGHHVQLGNLWLVQLNSFLWLVQLGNLWQIWVVIVLWLVQLGNF